MHMMSVHESYVLFVASDSHRHQRQKGFDSFDDSITRTTRSCKEM